MVFVAFYGFLTSELAKEAIIHMVSIWLPYGFHMVFVAFYGFLRMARRSS